MRGLWRYDEIHHAFPTLKLEAVMFLSFVYSLSIPNENRCRPSIEYIMNEVTYQAKRATIYMIQKLEAEGYIRIIRTPYERNEYLLTGKTLSAFSDAKDEPRQSANDAPHGVQKIHSTGCKNYTSRGAKNTPERDANFAPNNIEKHNIEKHNIVDNIHSHEERETKLTRFQKPTVEEVKAYFDEKGYNFDHQEQAETFVDFYTSKNWMVGSSPMKDWKAACRNWARGRNRGKKNPTDQYTDYFRSVDAQRAAKGRTEVSEEKKRAYWADYCDDYGGAF